MALVTGVPNKDVNKEPNLKERLKKRNKQRKTVRYVGAKSPIPAQIIDQEEYAQFYKIFKDVFIPYAGTDNGTADGMLRFLINLSEVSPTKWAVIDSKQRFSLSGAIEVHKKTDPDYLIEDEVEEVSIQDRKDFIGWIKESIELIGTDGRKISVKSFAKARLKSIEECGNFYFLMSKVDVLGNKKLQCRIIEPTQCKYAVVGDGEEPIIGVSKVWTLSYIQRKKPKYYPRYPEFDLVDGVERCIVHEKNDNGRWYGKPNDLASLNYQYLEYQNSDYLNTETENQFTGKALIEFEAAEGQNVIDDEGSQDNGFDSFADEVAYTFSPKSDDPLSLMVTERPAGANAVFVHEFSPNTNENWYRVTGEDAERQILKAHNWSKKLLGLTEASGLSTNEFKDVFQIASVTTIKGIQDEANYCINNIILKEAIEFYEQPQYEELSLVFTSPFKNMLVEEKEAEEKVEKQTNNPND